jgi:alpha-tubulin suppressor-like RCC1 family protein
VGNNTLNDVSTPVVIDSGVNYSSVSAGQSHTCGITTAGVLKCWGSLEFGLLGDGRFQSWKFPTPIW